MKKGRLYKIIMPYKCKYINKIGICMKDFGNISFLHIDGKIELFFNYDLEEVKIDDDGK